MFAELYCHSRVTEHQLCNSFEEAFNCFLVNNPHLKGALQNLVTERLTLPY